jgi:hypothetical protein
MVISTAADKKMVDDAEQKLMVEVDEIEKEFKRGLEKLNDKLTMMNCENLCTSILLKVLLTTCYPIVQFFQGTTPLNIGTHTLHRNSTTMVSSALVP